MSSVTRDELSVVALALLHVLVADAGPTPSFAIGTDPATGSSATGFQPTSGITGDTLPFAFDSFTSPSAARARLLISHHLESSSNGQAFPDRLYRNPNARQVHVAEHAAMQLRVDATMARACLNASASSSSTFSAAAALPTAMDARFAAEASWVFDTFYPQRLAPTSYTLPRPSAQQSRRQSAIARQLLQRSAARSDKITSIGSGTSSEANSAEAAKKEVEREEATIEEAANEEDENFDVNEDASGVLQFANDLADAWTRPLASAPLWTLACLPVLEARLSATGIAAETTSSKHSASSASSAPSVWSHLELPSPHKFAELSPVDARKALSHWRNEVRIQSTWSPMLAVAAATSMPAALAAATSSAATNEGTVVGSGGAHSIDAVAGSASVASVTNEAHRGASNSSWDASVYQRLFASLQRYPLGRASTQISDLVSGGLIGHDVDRGEFLEVSHLPLALTVATMHPSNVRIAMSLIHFLIFWNACQISRLFF